MFLSQRPIRDKTDIHLMIELAHQTMSENLHVVDLPYRLSSWALDGAENSQLWFDSNENLIAWIVMQTPFWTIDYVFHPYIGTLLHPQILAWADSQARKLIGTQHGRPAWFINVFKDQKNRIRDLETAGFVSQADTGEDSWTKVLMRRSSKTPVTESQLTKDFTIRPLNNIMEVSRYVAMHQKTFESKNMTISWRTCTLEQHDYRPDLDLVIEAPDGCLAAFCICWFKKTGKELYGQIEPFGAHPDYRQLGLGNALLNEGVKRLAEHGADDIFIETDNYRNAAYRLYEKVGFRVQRDALVYRKDFGKI